MNIYLAGGISGNLREFWQRVMKIYCASPKSRAEVVEAMKVYITGDNNKKKILRETLYGDDFFVKEGAQALSHINVLESYYYLRKNEEFMALVHHFGSFLLDSGAFTFMSGSHKGEIDWDKYVEDYAAFINRHDVKLFFELDIDSVVGLAEVERLRAKLEMLTAKSRFLYGTKIAAKTISSKCAGNIPMSQSAASSPRRYPANSTRKPFRGSFRQLTRTEPRFTVSAIPPSPICTNIISIQWIVPHGCMAIEAAISTDSIPILDLWSRCSRPPTHASNRERELFTISTSGSSSESMQKNSYKSEC